MPTNIFFISASDRLNYGDLLFHIIFKELCKKHPGIVFLNYGIVSSDLRRFGALPTNSYKKFLSDVKNNKGNIIIGGGEVLFPSWVVLYSFINYWYSTLVRSYKLRKLEERINIAGLALSNGRVRFPFSPSKKELRANDVRVFYNSVGGVIAGVKKKEDRLFIKNTLLEAEYISVRDNRSSESLEKNHIPCSLCPDSALIMSDLFPISYLQKMLTVDDSITSKPYIFLQLGRRKSPKDIYDFSDKLATQAEIIGCDILLCPIGQAPGHEDHIVLSRLSKLSDRFQLVEPGNIYDIMYLIAKSRGYVGTSLHGLITAQSFNIPFIPLNKGVSKMDNYSKTWLSSLCDGCIDFSEIGSLSKTLEGWDYGKMQIDTDDQKRRVYSNFDNIFNRLLH